MSRIYSNEEDKNRPSIDKKSVSDFFNRRVDKISTVGPVQAVIYQDNNPELAAKRNIAEKAKLLPLLELNGTQRVLDVGCGTGRWAMDLIPNCAWYHGIDACDGLLAYARNEFSSQSKCKFSTVSADDFTLSSLGENLAFDRILCAGILIYLNDDEARNALKCIFNVLAPTGLVLIREPMGLDKRLTISKHYSEELAQEYNAIYRTRQELMTMIEETVKNKSIHVKCHGSVYDDSDLNNRSDTRQEWILLEKSK